MIKKIIFLLVMTGLFFSCDTGSSDDSNPEEKFWGYANEGDLSLAIKKSNLTNDYYVMLSKKGSVTITIEGTSLKDKTNECTIVFDDSITSWDFNDEYAFYGDRYRFEVETYQIWEYTVKAVAVAEDEVNPQQIAFEKNVKVSFGYPTSTLYAPGDPGNDFLEIPEWGTATCFGYWDKDFRWPNEYWKMTAGTSGRLRLSIEDKGTETYSFAKFDSVKDRYVMIFEGDYIEEGTSFYLYLNQGSIYTEALKRYEYHVWIEEE